jgi:S-(hydroxymethyl)glutathione dehydrogenase/alcohol dehydrogenase
MKTEAMVCHAPGAPLVREILDLEPPGNGELLIEVMASGLCHTDLSQIEGTSAPFPFPVVVGHEGAGIVRALGTGVESLAVGDHVVPVAIGECGCCANCLSGRTNLCEAFLSELGAAKPRFHLAGAPVSAYSGVGSLARFIVMNERNVAQIRRDVPFDLACLVGCAVATGVGAVTHTARVEPGSQVVVFGLGGIGLNAVQGARLAGASRIIGVDRNSARAEQGRKFGLTDFVDAASADPVAAHPCHDGRRRRLQFRMRRACRGDGASRCFDTDRLGMLHHSGRAARWRAAVSHPLRPATRPDSQGELHGQYERS